jgi:hypothetical protein
VVNAVEVGICVIGPTPVGVKRLLRIRIAAGGRLSRPLGFARLGCRRYGREASAVSAVISRR